MRDDGVEELVCFLSSLTCSSRIEMVNTPLISKFWVRSIILWLLRESHGCADHRSSELWTASVKKPTV